MPCCPKCDKEFIDGIEICSNCGETLTEAGETGEAGGIEETEDTSSDIPDVPVRIYINKEQKHEDLTSSAFAFYFVGTIVTAFCILCWVKIINLPIHGIYKIIFQLALTAIGIFSLVVAIKSTAAARKLAPQIAGENQTTHDLIQWFADTYTGDEIDQAIDGTAMLAPEELSLRRFGIIQDYLITNHDLPDPSYVDALSEEIYSRLYESS